MVSGKGPVRMPLVGKNSPHQFRRTTLVIVCAIAVLGGIGLARTNRTLTSEWVWLAIVGGFCGLYSRRVVGLVLIVLFGVSLGWWRGGLYMSKLASYQQLTQRKVTIAGIAADDAVYNNRQQLTFPLSKLQVITPQPQVLAGTITVSGFGEAAVYRGDRVQVIGKLYPTRGNNQATIAYAQLQVLTRGHSPIDSARRHFAAGVQSTLPEPLASFGLGLLVGQRSTLPSDISNQLMVVGLTHLIAVSGYNLTILVEATRRLLGQRSKRQTVLVSFVLVGIFLLVAGSSASITRAAFVSVLGLIAWYYGRQIKPIVLLAVAAAGTAFWNPFYEWSSIGWYLSFLAFYGVLVMAPLLQSRLFQDRQPRLLTSMVIETLCAEVMTIPLILYIFGQMSLVALPTNTLVIAFVPLAMLCTAIAGLGGMILPTLAGWFAWPARLLLTYMLDTANTFARIPHAFVQSLSLPLTEMLLIYGMMVVITVLF